MINKIFEYLYWSLPADHELYYASKGMESLNNSMKALYTRYQIMNKYVY